MTPGYKMQSQKGGGSIIWTSCFTLENALFQMSDVAPFASCFICKIQCTQFSVLFALILLFTGSRGNNDYFDKYKPDIPQTEQDEEEMLRIALELSKSELSKEDKNNNKQKKQESKKIKEDKNFSVKVSADYGAEVPAESESDAGEGYFSGIPAQGTTRDVDEFSTYDNCESDDNQDTMSWYDNIGGLSDNSVYSPMPEVQKTYYNNRLGRDHPKTATSTHSHGSSRKSGLSHPHGPGARDTDHGDSGRRTNLRHSMGDDVRHHQNLHVPKSSKADMAKGSHHKH